jgi:hypothetical protein
MCLRGFMRETDLPFKWPTISDSANFIDSTFHISLRSIIRMLKAEKVMSNRHFWKSYSNTHNRVVHWLRNTRSKRSHVPLSQLGLCDLGSITALKLQYSTHTTSHSAYSFSHKHNTTKILAVVEDVHYTNLPLELRNIQVKDGCIFFFPQQNYERILSQGMLPGNSPMTASLLITTSFFPQ